MPHLSVMFENFTWPGILAGRDVLAALAVLDHVDRRIEPADLVERGADDAVDLDQEVEIAVRVFAGRH